MINTKTIYKSMTSPTIEQFYKITHLRLNPGDLSPIDLDIEQVKILYPEMTEEEIDDLTLEEFKKLNAQDWLEHAVPMESFALAGTIWKYKRRVGTSGYSITLRQMHAITEAMTKSNIEYLHHMLHVLYEPVDPVINQLEVLKTAQVAWVMPYVYQIKGGK